MGGDRQRERGPDEPTTLPGGSPGPRDLEAWELVEGGGLWKGQDLNTPHSFSCGRLKVRSWFRSRPVEAAPLCLPARRPSCRLPKS